MPENADTSQPGLVSIITVNYNQTELTCALLESIYRQDYRDVEVLVVDNASREDPFPVIQQRFPAAKCIRSDSNRGFAGGNNLALPQVKGEYIFYVNNDAEIPNGCIEQLLRLFQNDEGAGIVSPLICYHPGTTIQYAGMPLVNPFTGRSNMDGKGQENRGQYSHAFTTGYAHGAAMMIPARVLEIVGSMREDYFLYYEEIDWCERIRQAGFSVWVEPRACIWHKESMTMATLGTTKTYYMARNRILFMRHHYGGWRYRVFWLYLIFVSIPANTFRYLRKGEWKEMLAFLRGTFLM